MSGSDPVWDAVAQGAHHDPHSLLGAHLDGRELVFRVLRPFARSVTIRLAKRELAASHVRDGIWEARLKVKQVPDYRVLTSYESGDWLTDDAYRHSPLIGELDLHLIAEGRHEELWSALGSTPLTLTDSFGEIEGTRFTVWAPNAQAVRVVGDFNSWDGRGSAMRSLGSSGVWELFIPEVRTGARYKYQILTKRGDWITKIDPMARATEVPPATASVVHVSKYDWQDSEWMRLRANRDALKSPMSCYELHLGSWRGAKSYREVAAELVTYVSDMGFTHVEFMPLAEHPFGGSWGYQVTGYYSPTARFGDPDDLRYLIDQLHQAGIGVILDWVPAHFPKDDWALVKFDGEAIYEDADPRRGEHPDWGTLVFNFGRTEVRNFLVANACYWLEEFHIDALRVDAVASMLYLDYSRKDGEWLPNEFGGRENLAAIRFLQETNATVYKRYPGVMMIAEESTAFAGVSSPTDGGGLGFGFKWNMGWMHDSLEYIKRDPAHRRYHHGEITFSMLYAYDEKFVLPISHDEVVHGKGSLLNKMPGDHWQKLANLRAYLAFMWCHPGKQLLFMGSEFAQPSEWSESRQLDWWILEQPAHSGMQKLVRELNRNYRELPALWQLDHDPSGFQWLDAGNADQNVISFLRVDESGRNLACLINFSGSAHFDFRIGLPKAGRWREVLNTDATEFGGSGIGNLGAVTAIEETSHGRPASACVQLPPLAAVWLLEEH